MIKVVRNWLRGKSDLITLPDGKIIFDRYEEFKRQLPLMCKELRFNPQDLIYKDYIHLITEWIKKESQ